MRRNREHVLSSALRRPSITTQIQVTCVPFATSPVAYTVLCQLRWTEPLRPRGDQGMTAAEYFCPGTVESTVLCRLPDLRTLKISGLGVHYNATMLLCRRTQIAHFNKRCVHAPLLAPVTIAKCQCHRDHTHCYLTNGRLSSAQKSQVE